MIIGTLVALLLVRATQVRQRTAKVNLEKGKQQMKLRTLIFAGISLLFGVTSAQAAPMDLDLTSCPDDSAYIATGNVTGDVGGSDACFGAFDGNDPNADGMETNGQVFEFIAKAETVEQGGPNNNPADAAPILTGQNIGLNVTFGDCTTTTGADDNGCWSFTGLPDGYGDFIIVIKAANSPGWAAYLFSGTNNGSTSGTWQVAWSGGTDPTCTESVLGESNSGACAAVSHISIYAAKGGTTTVAEPGTLGLLGLGLLGIGFVRRRRIAG
jgi:hypothetical protein